MRWLVKLLRDKSRMQNQLLGELLKKARNDAGMTQTQAAARVARDQPFITRIESGSQQPTFVEVEQLAQAYGKQLMDFQTIKVIEQRNRNFAVKPDAVAEYIDLLLSRRRRLRQPKRRSPGKSRRRRR